MVADQIRQEVEVTFEDMGVVTDEVNGDVDVFVLDWNLDPAPPPYYVLVAGRRFHFTGETLLVRGHGAKFAQVVRGLEGEGKLVLFVERGGRYLIYTHDPNETDEDDAES